MLNYEILFSVLVLLNLYIFYTNLPLPILWWKFLAQQAPFLKSLTCSVWRRRFTSLKSSLLFIILLCTRNRERFQVEPVWIQVSFLPLFSFSLPATVSFYLCLILCRCEGCAVLHFAFISVELQFLNCLMLQHSGCVSCGLMKYQQQLSYTSAAVQGEFCCPKWIFLLLMVNKL